MQIDNHPLQATVWRPLLRVLSALFTEFAAASFIAGLVSIREAPLLLLSLFFCGMIAFAFAFVIEWIIDVYSLLSWTSLKH